MLVKKFDQMAISADALQAIAAKMRGNLQEGIMSTTTETSDALQTYKEDVKDIIYHFLSCLNF